MTDKNEKSHDENSNSNVRRRQFLHSIGGTFGLGLFTDVTKATVTSYVRIPRSISTDGVEAWKKVPRRWLDHFEQVKQIKKAFDTKVLHQHGVRSTAIVKSDKQIAGKNGFALKLTINSQEYTGAMFSSFRDIPVQTVEAGNPEPLGCYNQKNFDPMPGGVELNGSKGTGTSGYVVTQTKSNHPQNGEQFMITAPHLWGYNGGVANVDVGAKATRHSGNLGKVKDGTGSEDWCVVDKSLVNIGWEYKINNPEQSTEYRVRGYVPEPSVADLVSSDQHVYKSGCAVGFDGGPVTDMHSSDGQRSIDYSGEGIEAQLKGARGDSGGPAFALDGSYADLLFPVSMGDNKIEEWTCNGIQMNGLVRGMAAYEIANTYGYVPESN